MVNHKSFYEKKIIVCSFAYWSAFGTYYFCVGGSFVRSVVIVDHCQHVCIYGVQINNHFGHNATAGKIIFNAVRSEPVVSGVLNTHNIIACLAARYLFFVTCLETQF